MDNRLQKYKPCMLSMPVCDQQHIMFYFFIETCTVLFVSSWVIFQGIDFGSAYLGLAGICGGFDMISF